MSVTDQDELQRLINVLKLVLREKKTISVATLQTFLGIAISQGKFERSESVSMKEIARDIDVEYTAVSRQLDLLEDGYIKSEGLGFIKRDLDVNNGKQRIVRLTDEGRIFCAKISEAMRPS